MEVVGHRRSVALATVCAVLFLTFLDNTIVSVALADMQSSLRAGVSSLQWIVEGYMLAFAGLMLAGGTLGDLIGRKKVLLVGVVLFCAGSLVGALATGSGMLIAGRVVMGVGAAFCEPGTLSLIRQIYPGPARARPRARRLDGRLGDLARARARARRRARRGRRLARDLLVQPRVRRGDARARPRASCPRAPIRKAGASTYRASSPARSR